MENDGKEEIEDDLQSTLEELYEGSIKIAKHSKELKKLVETLSLNNEELKSKVENLEQVHKEENSTKEELAHQVVKKDDELHKLLGGFTKAIKYAIDAKSPHCKFRLRRGKSGSKFNKSNVVLVKLLLLVLV